MPLALYAFGKVGSCTNLFVFLCFSCLFLSFDGWTYTGIDFVLQVGCARLRSKTELYVHIFLREQGVDQCTIICTNAMSAR